MSLLEDQTTKIGLYQYVLMNIFVLSKTKDVLFSTLVFHCICKNNVFKHESIRQLVSLEAMGESL